METRPHAPPVLRRETAAARASQRARATVWGAQVPLSRWATGAREVAVWPLQAAGPRSTVPPSSLPAQRWGPQKGAWRPRRLSLLRALTPLPGDPTRSSQRIRLGTSKPTARLQANATEAGRGGNAGPADRFSEHRSPSNAPPCCCLTQPHHQPPQPRHTVREPSPAMSNRHALARRRAISEPLPVAYTRSRPPCTRGTGRTRQWRRRHAETSLQDA